MKPEQLPKGLVFATGLPGKVLAGQTTRKNLNPLLASAAPFDGFNLALHVGDDPVMVQQQRIELLKALEPAGAKRLVWLEQTHSTLVHEVTAQPQFLPVNADALISCQMGVACMIMTADCLPIILSNMEGTEVACIHAGWRGLLNGIVENTLHAMQSTPVYAWFGTAIGCGAFEVGSDVFEAFTRQDSRTKSAFKALGKGKYLADINALARLRLHKLGVTHMLGSEHCSYQEQTQYYSYRRRSHTGRMATFVMIRPN
ncbi:peptidoglycan editing factor PgeF [Alkanindiges sp. WGS2144]|uniref:peptidoglycan editing factor PgeF n=1 Tax=Alkanindiges sp. WGS2144 TaxID=3366808 RepID=UPI0037538EE0